MNLPTSLKSQVHRLTAQRKAVVGVLEKHAGFPLTVKEIHELLKQKRITVDLASIYRSLELFVEMGIIETVDLGDDKKRYELTNNHNHHHHLVCNSCGSIEDIKINESSFLKNLDNKTGFKVEHHHLEFFGQCRNCQ